VGTAGLPDSTVRESRGRSDTPGMGGQRPPSVNVLEAGLSPVAVSAEGRDPLTPLDLALTRSSSTEAAARGDALPHQVKTARLTALR
jgi:hypothetical protein